ncbi:RNA polymerase sigma factor [Planctomycetota bacterium]
MGERIPDEALVGAFIRGDEAVFDAIVSRYSADVTNLANRLLAWPGDVDDVIQEVFLAAYINLKRFRGQCSLRTWLFTITINKCRSQTRRQWIRRKVLAGLAQRAETYMQAGGSNGELVEAVSRSLQRLSARYREPVILYYLEGLSVEQIGAVLKLSPNAVHVRLNRARKRLKEHLVSWEHRHE